MKAWSAVSVGSLLLFIVLSASAYGGVPEGQRGAEPHPAIVGQEQNESGGNKSGARSPAPGASAKPSQGPADAKDKHEDENLQIQRRLADANETVARFTRVLAYVGAAQAVVLCLQLFALRGTLRATKEAADAAKESAGVARDALHKTERAFLTVDHATMSALIVGQRPRITATIRNSGRTPGQIVTWGSTLAISEIAPAEPTYTIWESPHLEVGANTPREFTMTRTEPFTQRELDRMTAPVNPANVMAWAHFRYSDTFGLTHVFRFGLWSGLDGHVKPIALPSYSEST